MAKDDERPSRPAAIKISGTSKGNVFVDVKIEGDSDGVVIEDSATDNKFLNLTHNNPRHQSPVSPEGKPENQAEKSAEHWYKKPIGIVGIAVASGLLVFLAIYLIKTHFGIS